MHGEVSWPIDYYMYGEYDSEHSTMAWHGMA